VLLCFVVRPARLLQSGAEIVHTTRIEVLRELRQKIVLDGLLMSLQRLSELFDHGRGASAMIATSARGVDECEQTFVALPAGVGQRPTIGNVAVDHRQQHATLHVDEPLDGIPEIGEGVGGVVGFSRTRFRQLDRDADSCVLLA
jgi:hypothetical protein